MKQLFLLALFAFLATSCKRVEVNTTCTVMSHVASLKTNSETMVYTTQVQCDDGNVRELEGINSYVLKEGARIPYKYSYFK